MTTPASKRGVGPARGRKIGGSAIRHHFASSELRFGSRLCSGGRRRSCALMGSGLKLAAQAGLSGPPATILASGEAVGNWEPPAVPVFSQVVENQRNRTLKTRKMGQKRCSFGSRICGCFFGDHNRLGPFDVRLRMRVAD